MLSKKLFPQQILKLIFLNVKQMAFTLMNEEFEFLCFLMTSSFNKDIRPHSQQLYSHQLLSIIVVGLLLFNIIVMFASYFS